MGKRMRWLMVLTAMLLALCLAGCGAKAEEVEESQEAASTPVPTVEPTPVPTPAPDPKIEENGFTFTVMNRTMFTTANLNVRSLPQVEGEKIGMFHKGAEVQVSGRCEETGWYRVQYGSEIGYCSDEYLE